MKTVIVEDSPLAVAELKELLRQHPQIDVIAHAGNVEAAIATIEQHRPELVFMDINMPGGDGFDVLEQLNYTPKVIFTTAYDEYAIKSFEYNALDYLLKPVNPNRLEQALQKLGESEHKSDKPNTSVLPLNHKIFARLEEQCWLVPLADIRYFEASGSQCWLHFDEHKAPINKGLGKIEERLEPSQFIKINRQQIVNLNFLQDLQLDDNGGMSLTLSCGKELQASRRAASQIKQIMSF